MIYLSNFFVVLVYVPVVFNGCLEEQLGKAKVIDEDPTQKYTSKIQKHLCKLRKEKKFTDKEYFEIYPSDPIPPRLFGS